MLRVSRNSSWVLTALLAGLMLAAAMASARAETKSYNILLVSSYHPTFNTYESIMSGVREVLTPAPSLDVPEVRPAQPTITLDVEFMDSKRLVTQRHLVDFRRRLAEKMSASYSPDLIMVADDNAFKFALEEQNRLFRGLPIVFLGVGDVERAVAQNTNPQMTGVVERPSIVETIQVALQIATPGEKVHVLFDATTTGRVYLRRLRADAAFSSMAGRLNILSLDDISFDDLAGELRNVSPKGAVVLVSAYRDYADTTQSIQEITKLITENSKAPFLHPWPSSLGRGSLGGMLVSHYEQGRTAAKIAREILLGASPGDLPVVAESPNVYEFDHAVMTRFGLDPSLFPETATIHNEPTSAFERNKKWFIGGGLFLALQFAIILVLSIAIVRRRAAEKAHAASEAKLRDILDVSTDWYWECDRELVVTHISERFEQLTGIPAAERVGTGLFGQLPDNLTRDDETVVAGLKNLTGAHAPFREFELPARTGDGGTRYVRISGTPVVEGSDFQGYRGAGTDITKEVEARRKLANAMAELEALSQAKSTFLANISHELRTPLNAVNGMSEAISNEVFGPIENARYQEYATHINESGRHLQQVLDDVLDLSRIEANTQTLVDEVIDLADIIRSCRVMLTDHLSEREIRLAVTGAEAGLKVMADPTRLRQILLNLMSNAVRFSPVGGQVTIDVRPTSGNDLRISIADTGCGIAEADLDRVLRPYEQVASHMTATSGGMGLGLPLAKMLTELHGGTLNLSSRVGQGTTAIVTLPADRFVTAPAGRADDPEAADGQPEAAPHRVAANK